MNNKFQLESITESKHVVFFKETTSLYDILSQASIPDELEAPKELNEESIKQISYQLDIHLRKEMTKLIQSMELKKFGK